MKVKRHELDEEELFQGDIKIVEIPEYKYELKPFGENAINISLVERPIITIRIWMWLFFGWRFKKIKEGGK